MNTVTISPKYQIVIPQVIRVTLCLQPGEKFQILQYGNRIELIPAKTLKSMRGFLSGIDTCVPRERDIPHFQKTGKIRFKRKR